MLKAALHYLGTRLARPIYGGAGSILALHRVVPEAQRSRLSVNRALEITPEDLDGIIRLLKDKGYEFVAMDDVLGRLQARSGRKFVAVTLDDGYRDNAEHALPVFERHGVPFTVYVTKAFSEHRDCLWWFSLEEALVKRDRLEFADRGGKQSFDLTDEKSRLLVFESLARGIRSLGRTERDEFLRALFDGVNVDPLRATRELILDEDELRRLAQHRLVTIGAHTVHHVTSNVHDEATVRGEFHESKEWTEGLCGREVRHLAYPFGGRNAVGAREFRVARECGFATAVTTRFANVFPAHARNAWALPRLEISGNYRADKFTERAVSGLLPAMRNGWRRVVTD
jgi:peptidoglycan/xylan/chitin deacetylase (PgdA/CDA1 family)